MEKLFIKSASRSLDAKGRLMLPGEYRDSLFADNDEGRFWLTSRHGCLVAYLPRDWEKITSQLLSIPQPSEKLSKFMTKFMGLGEEITPDSQGRVRVPQPLMREAALQKDVMVVGMYSKFQIWDQCRFDAIQQEDISVELAAAGVSIPL